MRGTRRNFLISPGGSGVNFFWYLFDKPNLSGGMLDYNPHQRYTHLPDDARVIYLMAHPLDILLSFERRDFFETIHMCQNIQGDVNSMWHVIRVGGGLKNYINVGVNCLDITGHFKGWKRYCKEKGLPFAFLKYPTIPENFDALKKYLRLPPVRPWEWNKRESNWQKEKRFDMKRLKAIHKRDIRLYEGLPDFLIIE